jgi:Flp pilus assembly protein CpaB
MNSYRARNTAIAGALAAVAVLLTLAYVRNVRNDAEQGSSLVRVMVAVRDIVAGTPGNDVALAPREVPRRAVVPGAITSKSQVAGLVAADQIYAGEQATTMRFVPAAEQGIVGQLKGNQRALQVPGDQYQLLAGTLRADDRVDVVGNIKYRVDKQRAASRVVLRDIRVLQAPETPDSSDSSLGSGNKSFSAILAVTDAQAQKLFYVMQNGGWSLELRPKNRPKDTPDGVETAESVLTDGLKPSGSAQVRNGWAEVNP